jgi:hypothetical protein
MLRLAKSFPRPIHYSRRKNLAGSSAERSVEFFTKLGTHHKSLFIGISLGGLVAAKLQSGLSS